MPSLGMIFVLAQLSATPSDCGASRYSALILRTHGLIKKSAEPVFNSEQINMGATDVCVRVEFSIDSHGNAVKIRTVEGFYSRAFNKAVVDALGHFEFAAPKPEEKNDFMLVFRPREPK